MGLLGNMVILFLTFHTLQYINIRVTLINISTNSIQGVPYLYIQALLPFLFLIVILTSDTPLQFWFPFDNWLSTSGSSGIVSSSSESQYSYILPLIWKAGKQRGRRNGNVRVRRWSSTQWFTSLNGHKSGLSQTEGKSLKLAPVFPCGQQGLDYLSSFTAFPDASAGIWIRGGTTGDWTGDLI